MKTLKILSEKEFNKISKNKAVWYEKITLNGVTFSCVVIDGEEPEYYIKVKENAETRYVQQDRSVFLGFSVLAETFNEKHDNTY